MISKRQKETLKYLVMATVVSAFTCYFFLAAPPLLFGLALAYSNRLYLKDRVVYIAMPLAFFIWFFLIWGVLYTSTPQIVSIAYCYVTFCFVFGIAKSTIDYIHIGLIQIVLLLALPIIALFIISKITSIDIGQLDIDHLAVIVLVYQSCMAVVLISAVKEDPLAIKEKKV